MECNEKRWMWKKHLLKQERFVVVSFIAQNIKIKTMLFFLVEKCSALKTSLLYRVQNILIPGKNKKLRAKNQVKRRRTSNPSLILRNGYLTFSLYLKLQTTRVSLGRQQHPNPSPQNKNKRNYVPRYVTIN